MRTLLIFAILVLCMFQNACTRSLPNMISPFEYAVYSAWLTSHVQHENDRAQEILIESHTFPVNKDFDRKQCQLPNRLFQPLLDAGDAEYPIRNTPTERITAPFEFRLVDGAPHQPTKSFELISFTRVAFTPDYSEGLFWVSSDHRCERSNLAGDNFVCGGGRGGFVRANNKTGGHWEFHQTSPCMAVE
jgi:hypothetical protein